ncbi:class I SAM-dependent methyltransferase [Oceanicella actignis]|uniref:Methyltransferase domain-containing protein n=1 Tax=Oceanicella actignis TaxID=1189325 RepID=A0A1M7RRS9_9RHOB|nr:methyltransferase domain-containing protein [Oceanicella actignis]SET06608.1 Methyltransferase domain-containing protein [Oceanicella actignis]SHN48959.1 Methyltransferase domain-containing protein [Oceanicella actignis]
MTNEPPLLFDRALLMARRARVGAPGAADFLHAEAAAGAAERLLPIAREFPRAALVWPGAPAWRRALEAAPSVGRIDEVPLRADETLELPEGAYDLAVCGLTLHWANDPVGALIQMRRALRPDGLMIACLLGGATLHELRAALAEAEAAEEGGLSPRVAPMAEIRDLGGLLQRAGFAMPVADGDRIQATYADPLALMRELRAMGETNVMTARRRRFLRRATLARACEIYARHFPAPGGRVRATFEIITLTGWAPGPGQPKPRRPGSATARLADALGVPELPAGEKAPRAPAAPPSTDGPGDKDGGQGGRS